VGVDLFFIISGFIMVYTTTRRTVTPIGFFRNRLTRIVPFYWFMTALVCALAISLPKLMAGTKYTLPHMVKSLFFIPYIREDGTIMPILFVGWSLNLEMLFYLFFAIAIISARPALRVLLTVSCLGILVALGYIFSSRLSPEARFLTQPIMLEFALGMVIGLMFERLPSSRRAGRIAVATILPIFVILLLVARYTLPGEWPFSALPAAVLVTTVLVAERSGHRINLPGVVLIGDASYALYLTHPFVTQSVIFGARRLHLLHFTWVPVLALLSLLMAVAVGIFSHLLIEKPLGRMVGKVFFKPRPASVMNGDGGKP
jgi:peptidoglycan/LPS O-acetylase OafA/YrhL